HCAALQMTPGALRVIAVYTLIIARTLGLAGRPGTPVTRTEIEAGADRYVRLTNRRHPRRPEKRRGGYLWLSFTRYAIRWLTFLGRLQVPSPAPRPYADHIASYREYLHRERGLSPLTIAKTGETIQAFLEDIDDAGLRLRALTVAQV